MDVSRTLRPICGLVVSLFFAASVALFFGCSGDDTSEADAGDPTEDVAPVDTGENDHDADADEVPDADEAPDADVDADANGNDDQDTGEDSLEGDLQALLDIYEATDGDNWDNNDGWDSMTVDTMGDAYGVETDADGRVVEINLVENHLVNSEVVGTDSEDTDILELIDGREFPSSVINLKRLRYFNVKANHITGPIPEGFMHLEELEQLLLSGRSQQDPRYDNENHPGKSHAHDLQNAWTGELPSDWSKLTNLFAVEISHHRMEAGLTGELPQSLFDLPNIELIVLYTNNFSGEIPEISEPEESKLAFIALQGASYTDESLSGPLPESWGELQEIDDRRFLRVSSNRDITGPFPESWEDMTRLSMFRGAGTGLSGPFPDFLFSEDNPMHHSFGIENTDIEGPLPSELPSDSEGRWAHMSIFGLNDIGLGGEIPNWVTEMGIIQGRFRNNDFIGELPEGFHDPDSRINDRLRYLHLQGNDLEGPLPDVSYSSSLGQWLHFQGNSFSGSVPSAWADIEGSIHRIRVDGNELSGEIPDLSTLDDLTDFRVQNNRFVFADLIPNFDALDDHLGDGFEYAPQKPFGDSELVTLSAGEDFEFEFTEVSDPNNDYQWTKDGSDLSGENSASLNINSVDESDAGDYRLLVTNSEIPELELESEVVELSVD